ncbi:hypothetical protein ACFODQ_06010 [Comamonas sp. JC664]
MTVAAAASSAWSKRATTTETHYKVDHQRSYSEILVESTKSTAAPGSIPCMCTPPMA